MKPQVKTLKDGYEAPTITSFAMSLEAGFCISGLSEQCRRVFLLSRMTGLKNREIAERLNISVKTVEKHIGSALAKLRLRLGRSGFLRLFL